jgi:hypothetical protein
MPRLTSDQYRNLAEGLLNKALDVEGERKSDHIRDAIRYLRHARAQDRGGDDPDGAANLLSPNGQQDTQQRLSLVRQLLKQALEAPTPRGLEELLHFGSKFRRLSVWNAHMAYIQRPGARMIASESEWKKEGRYVQPDAVPIIILWPRSPIRFVYELEDTGPLIDRREINDPFAVEGQLPSKVMDRLAAGLSRQKTFKIRLEERRQGFSYAGSATAQDFLPNGRIGEFAHENSETGLGSASASLPAYRITFNGRLNTAERFVTITHELGHIFCGHLFSPSGGTQPRAAPRSRGIGAGSHGRPGGAVMEGWGRGPSLSPSSTSAEHCGPCLPPGASRKF